MSELYIYKVGDYEWHVAESPEDAIKSSCELSGESPMDFTDDDVRKLSDDEVFRMHYDDEFDVPNPLPEGAEVDRESGIVVSATCKSWLAISKRGFFAGTDW